MPDLDPVRSRKSLVESLQTLRLAVGDHSPVEPLLPGLELKRGALVEWLGAAGGGATTLALLAARETCRQGLALAVVDAQRQFYPPAAAELGVDLESLVVVCPRNQRDHLWALTQVLSCPAVGAMLCWPERLDDKAFRRLQLAAERGGTWGFLLRPLEARGQPSWAELQLLVQAVPTEDSRRFQGTVLRSRSGTAGRSLEWELDHETNALRLASSPSAAFSSAPASALSLASQLAPAAAAARPARARSSGGRAV